mmetsp:Transcript_7789/g.19305  ORF Transcript_7789/g.19305 Transcript_7789/m.19305 type:complete len:226 (-) Transcript_7789:392-1069(-)
MIGIGGAPEQPQSCAVASGVAWTSAPTRSKFGRGADSSAASAAAASYATAWPAARYSGSRSSAYTASQCEAPRGDSSPAARTNSRRRESCRARRTRQTASAGAVCEESVQAKRPLETASRSTPFFTQRLGANIRKSTGRRDATCVAAATSMPRPSSAVVRQIPAPQCTTAHTHAAAAMPERATESSTFRVGARLSSSARTAARSHRSSSATSTASVRRAPNEGRP